MIYKERKIFMFFEIFNHIVFDNEMDVISCLDDEYIRAEMTAEEILEIVPEIKKIMESKDFFEIQAMTNDFIYELPISQETVEEWEKNGLSDLEKFFITNMYSSLRLEEMRYHVCQICNKEYFSKDMLSDICDSCAQRYYHI